VFAASLVLDAFGIAIIAEAARELSDEPEFGFDLAQQQTAGIRSDLATVERADNLAVAKSLEIKKRWGTLCHNAMASRVWDKDLVVKPLCQIRGHRARVLVRIAG
jgi:hypothetical protein